MGEHGLTQSVLLIFAHPAFQRSRANRALVEAVRGLPGVTFHDLYEAYPDFVIDVAREQELLLAHDALVFQHPFYWYSSPAHVKEWFDVVLTHGFAYGLSGTALNGKPWLTAVTAGGREIAYQRGGSNRFTVEELLRPVEATASLCGCDWQEPFVLYGSHLVSDSELAAQAADYRNRVAALCQAPGRDQAGRPEAPAARRAGG